LNKLRSELIQNKTWKEREISAIKKEFGEIRRKVDSYTQEKYKLYLRVKESYGNDLERELNRWWFFQNKQLIHDLQSKIEEYAPPVFCVNNSYSFLNPPRALELPSGTIPELISLLNDPSKWPIPESVWNKQIERSIESRTHWYIERIAAIEREIARREEAKARKAEEDAKLVYAVERKARMKNLSKDSRSEGYGLRRLLSRNHPCPYCSGPLGPSPHADHIYPIHKGGRSTFANMVYICNDCNSKKGKMTLQQFIKKFKLNREQIEKTLLDLNKEF
jgi:5-methylcytosine-specific restriction endonuclease McrA